MAIEIVDQLGWLGYDCFDDGIGTMQQHGDGTVGGEAAGIAAETDTGVRVRVGDEGHW